MYHSDQNEDNGEGLIVWELDIEGIRFLENQVIDDCPGGQGHRQYRDYRCPKQIVMQYAEIKDRDGKQIYEGDILSNNFGTDKQVLRKVTFEKGSFWLEKISGRSSIPFKVLLHEFAAFNYSVVGNIYQNPELINPEND